MVGGLMERTINILFISSGTSKFGVVPFIKSQEQSLIDNGVSLDHFLIIEGGIKGYYKSIGKLREQLKTKKYDVIHAHYAYCGWVAVLAFSGIPIVISYMGSDVYGMVDAKGNRTLKSYPVIFLAKLLQPFVSKIIVKSENLANYVYLKSKCEIIPNGVDYQKFMSRDKQAIRKKLGLDINKKYVVFLANAADPRKNIALVEEAIIKSNEPDWEILNPYPIAPDEIPQYINAGDVLVLTSYLEGSPNVIKEGMASSIPIVATDVGDVVDIIGITDGCYVTDFDADDMAKKLKLAIGHGETTGRKDIEYLEINTVAKRIIELYEELVSP